MTDKEKQEMKDLAKRMEAENKMMHVTPPKKTS